MASKTAATKPKQDFNAIGQLARKALLLAEAHAVAIGDRLPAGFTKRLADDVANLDRAVPAAMNSKDGRIQLTAAQTTALAWGHSVVMAIRAAVKSEEPDRDVLLAFGVGTRVNRRVVKDVKAALKKIIDRLAAQPGDVQRFDIVQDDVDGLTASLIETADRDQEAGRAGGRRRLGIATPWRAASSRA